MAHIEIRNWRRFQHYHKRTPPWIKLYNSLLDDPDFLDLPPDQKWCLVGLFLLASRHENRIPDRVAFLTHHLGCKPDLKVLSPWIVRSHASKVLAKSEQLAIPEGEREGEERESTPRRKRRRDSRPERKVPGPEGELLRHFGNLHRQVLGVAYVANFKAEIPALRRQLNGSRSVKLLTLMVEAFWQEQRANRAGEEDAYVGKATPTILGFIGQIPNLLNRYKFNVEE